MVIRRYFLGTCHLYRARRNLFAEEELPLLRIQRFHVEIYCVTPVTDSENGDDFVIASTTTHA
jgi:hypothetical protein